MPRKRKRSSKHSSWLCSLQDDRVSKELRRELERSNRGRNEIRRDESNLDANIIPNGERKSLGVEDIGNNIGEVADFPQASFTGNFETNAVLHTGTNGESIVTDNEVEERDSLEESNIFEAESSGAGLLNTVEQANDYHAITPFEGNEMDYVEEDVIHDTSGENKSLAISRESGAGGVNEGGAHQYNARHVNSELRRWENPYELLSLVMVTGSVRFSVQQYEVVRCLPLAAVYDAEEGEMSSYNAVRRLHQRLQKTIYPEAQTAQFEVLQKLVRSTEVSSEVLDESRSEEVDALEAGESEVGRVPVRIVLPTSWARHDVGTLSTYRFLYGSESSSGMHERSIEKSDIVRNRHIITCPGRYIYAGCGNGRTQLSAGSTIKVSVAGVEPSLNKSYKTKTDGAGPVQDGHESHYLMEAEIAEVWYVGSEKGMSASAREALRNPNLSEREKAFVRCLSQKASDMCVRSEGSAYPLFLPGDQCVLLRSRRYMQAEESYAILLYRFWKDRDGIPSSTVLWCNIDDDGNATRVVVKKRQVVVSTEAGTRVPAEISMNDDGTEKPRVCTKNQGVLQDGTPYVVYRVLLYCDDFKPSSSLYPRGSAGGCYMLPIGLPPEARRTTSSVRVISLTPAGVSTNSVLHYIVQDIVDGTVNGIMGVTPDGSPVKIFLDLVGFIGDYPASAHAVDVMGHISRAPCTHCAFRKLEKKTVGRSRNGYSTNIHSCNSSSLRCGERHKALRESNIPDRDANRLGLRPSWKVTDCSAPLIYVQERLNEKRCEIPLNNSGELVVSGLFDAYRCNVVAPDHLLSGLAINLMDALFKEMSEDDRLRADSYIVSALMENGLLKQNQVYNPRTKKMNSMSLSSVFCVFAVSSQIMDIVFADIYYDEEDTSLMKLLIQAGRNLQRLITYSYWWPTKDLDGEEAVQLVSGNGRETYFRELQNMAVAYVAEIDDICSKYPESQSLLDKPNLHRLLELYFHSVPNFGHCREFSELVFEHAHQPLKRCIARSNHQKSELFAVDHCVANDWQGRLASLHNEVSSRDEKVRELARQGLRRLILGPCSCYTDETGREEIRIHADQAISKLFNKGLMRMFKQHSLVSHFASRTYTTWRASRKVANAHITGCFDEQENSETVLKYAVQQLRMHYPVFTGDGVSNLEIEMHSEARRTRVHLSDENLSTPLGGHDVLQMDCAIQARVDGRSIRDGRAILTSDAGSPIAIFAVLAVAVAKRSGEGPWVLVTKCKVLKDRAFMIKQPLGKKSVQWLQLSETVRRIGVYHDCRRRDEHGRKCVADVENGRVMHSGTLLSGAKMRYQTRRQGYPPRMG